MSLRTENRVLYILIGIVIGLLLGNKTFITTTKIVMKEVSNVRDIREVRPA